MKVFSSLSPRTVKQKQYSRNAIASEMGKVREGIIGIELLLALLSSLIGQSPKLAAKRPILHLFEGGTEIITIVSKASQQKYGGIWLT